MFRVLILFFVFLSQPLWATTLLVFGDSLSAGYQMPLAQSWPSLIAPKLQQNTGITKVVNASISGDTTGNGLSRLPRLLQIHQPQWVLIELGANDGLRGFPPKRIEKNLQSLIALSRSHQAKVMLMQIEIPPNYGKRYTQAFADLYPKIAEKEKVPLLPFFMEKVVLTPGWLMKDGLHPTEKAQPWIADFVAENIIPYLNKEAK